MRRSIVEASKAHVISTQAISRSLVEKAMTMRCVSYYSDAKSALLTQTIFEVEHSKKMILKVNQSLARSKKIIQEKNRILEEKVQQRTRQVTRANRALSMLNRCHQLQIRASDEAELLDETCKLIASEDAYNLAWINTSDTDNPGALICPVAYAGIAGQGPEKSTIACQFPGTDQCPATVAIQYGMVCIYKENDPGFCSCPMQSGESGSRSLISLPLKTNQTAFGTLNICSMKANAFQGKEIYLLEDLASDISFGIHSFRLQTERDLAYQKIRDSLNEKDSMLREIHHRVRNNLQIVISLLRMQSRRTKNQKFKAMAVDCEQRIMALASIHEELYTTDDLGSINCQTYFRRISDHLLHMYGMENVSIHVNALDMRLSINEAIPCGQIFHELVSNALKYAFLDGREGVVSMHMAHTTERIEFTIEDNGVGLPAGFDFHTCGNMGLELVRLLTEQLDGSLELSRNGGTRWKISFPSSPSIAEKKKD